MDILPRWINAYRGVEWMDRLGKWHETFDRIKYGIYGFSDEKFNSIALSFSMAMRHNAGLLIDVVRIFIWGVGLEIHYV